MTDHTRPMSCAPEADVENRVCKMRHTVGADYCQACGGPSAPAPPSPREAAGQGGPDSSQSSGGARIITGPGRVDPGPFAAILEDALIESLSRLAERDHGETAVMLEHAAWRMQQEADDEFRRAKDRSRERAARAGRGEAG